MNFIKVNVENIGEVLVNLNTVTTIAPTQKGAVIYFDGDENIKTTTPFDEIFSLIETMQRRSGR